MSHCVLVPQSKSGPAIPLTSLEMHIPPWLWFSITTTLAQFGQLLAGNRFAEGKATKLPSARAGRDEEASRSLSFEPSL